MNRAWIQIRGEEQGCGEKKLLLCGLPILMAELKLQPIWGQQAGSARRA